MAKGTSKEEACQKIGELLLEENAKLRREVELLRVANAALLERLKEDSGAD